MSIDRFLTQIHKIFRGDARSGSPRRRCRITESLEQRTLLTAPWSTDDSYALMSDEEIEASNGLLSNDYDYDGDYLTASIYSYPQSGSVTLNSDGSFSYYSYTGSGTDTFSYQAYDGTQFGNVATVTITVNQYDGGYDNGTYDDETYDDETYDDGTYDDETYDDETYDDETYDDETYDDETYDDETYDDETYDDETYDDGTYDDGTYDDGTYDDGTYDDGTGGSTVTSAADSFYVEQQSYGVQLDVLANDTGDYLSISSVGSPSNGTANITTDYSSGEEVIGYSPDSTFTGQDTFSYDATDYYATDSSTVTVDVHQVDNTLASARSLSFSGGVASSSGVVGDGPQSWSDVDLFELTLAAGDVVTADIDAAASDNGGSLSGLDSYLRIFDSSGTELASADNGIDPETTAFGTDSVLSFTASSAGTYFIGVSDSQNATYDPNYSGGGYSYSSGAYNLTVSVAATNDPPEPVADSWDLIANSSLSVPAAGVLANDIDADGDSLTALMGAWPDHGTLSLQSDGSFDYTPNTDFTGTDSFTYVATDGTAAALPTTVTLTVFAAPVIASPETWSTAQDTSLAVDAPGVLGNDWDLEGDSLIAVQGTAPANGTLTLNADGSFEYLPNPGFLGTDSFTYHSSDGANDSDPVTVTLQVTNFAPIASGDFYTTSHDRTLNVAAGGLFTNDVDIENGILSAIQVSSTSNGQLTLQADGGFDYVPNVGFVGADSFSYQVSDGPNFSNVVDVTISVVNTTPTAGDDVLFTPAGVPLLILAQDLLVNDFDANDDDVSLSVVAPPNQGTLTDQGDGTWLYTPDPTATGSDTFTYRLSDGLENSETATVEIKLSNAAPLAINDYHTVSHDRVLTVTSDGVLSNDVDSDDDSLTVVAETLPSSGVLQLNADGSFDYTPAAGFTGTDTFTYRVSDGFSLSATAATVTINVVNSTPVSRSDSYDVHQGQLLTIASDNGLLQNDNDHDGDILTASLQTAPENGTLALSPDGSFTFQPNGGFSGTDHFTYRITDGLGYSEDASVEVHVANIEPVSAEDSYSVPHDQILTRDAESGLLGNDFDLDGDSLSVAVTSSPASGTLVLSDDGSFSYTPDAGFIGNDSFEYTATDGAATTEPVTVSVSVTNTTPSAANRSFAVLHDQTLTIAAPGLFAFAGDGESDLLTLTNVSTPQHGALTVNADGSFIYVPNAGFVGEDTITYQLSDGLASSSEATVTFQVFNNAPLATDDVFAGSHGRTISSDATGGLLANDIDLNFEQLTVSVETDPLHGTLTLNADGSFDYQPDAGFVGEDSFEYRASDGAAFDIGLVRISLTNAAPVVTSDIYGVLPDTTLVVDAANGVLANDEDADDDPLTIEVLSQPENGGLTLQADGSFTFVPEVGFVGVNEFSYRVADDLNTTSNVAFVAISTALVANDDRVDMIHDRTVSGNLIGNDFDAYGLPLTVVANTTSVNGTLDLQPNGDFTYTPAPGFTGVEEFSYHLDNGTEQSNPAVVTFHVTNSSPQAFDATWRGSHGSVIESGTDRGLAYRSYDRDEDLLTYELVTQSIEGTVVLHADGSFDYTPTDVARTGLDSFEWRVFDGVEWSEIATAWIESYNFLPLLGDDSYEVHSQTVLTVNVDNGLARNDSDADEDVLAFEIVDTPTHGSIVLNSDGSFIYTPDVSVANAEDSFTYRVFDGAEYSEVADVVIDIRNALPHTTGGAFSVVHDTVLTVAATDGVLSNAFDSDDDVLTAILATDVTNGSLTLNDDGSFDYVPNSGLVGTDTFTYTVSDGREVTEPVLVTIDVTNQTSSVGSDTVITRRGQSALIVAADLLDNDFDPDDDAISLVSVTAPSNGTLSDNGDGTWTYQPAAGFAGTDTFTYSISDGVETVAADVEIIVLNAAPVAGHDRFEITHSVPYSAVSSDVLSNDYDLEDDLVTASLVRDVEHGVLTLNSDGSFDYTPDADFVGRDSFSYQLSDGDLSSEPVLVTLDVTNARPTVRESWHRLVHDTTLSVDADSGLLDAAADSDNDTLTANIVSSVNNGTLQVGTDGAWSYTPDPGFVGTDSFTYRVSDGLFNSTATTVRLEVTNTPVVASLDAFHTVPDVPLSVAAPGILQNDSDIDGDDLTLTVVDEPRHGTVTVSQDGSFVWTPNNGFVGSDAFIYLVSDGIESATATVQLTVAGVGGQDLTAPAARPDHYRVQHSQTLDVSADGGVLASDNDPNGDSLTAQLVTGPSNGTLAFNGDGSFLYTPDPGSNGAAPFTGTDTFTYSVSDGVESETAVVEISVTNSLPWSTNATFEVHQGQAVSTEVGDLSRAAGDADGDTLTYSKVSDPSHGTLVFNADGTFSYTPGAGFTGVDSFTYRVADAVGNSHTATVDLDVTNERPSVLDYDFRTQHDTALTESGNGLLTTAFDTDGDELTASVSSAPANGVVTLNPDGTFEYTPDAGFSGTDEFRFRVHDGAAYSYESRVTIQVENQAPVAEDSIATGQHSTEVPISLTAWDTDDDQLVFEVVAAPDNGSLVYENVVNNGWNAQPITFTGSVAWQPPAGFVGEDRFEYRVSDGIATSDTAVVRLSTANFAPRVSGAFHAAKPGTPLTVAAPGLLVSASDGDGDTLTLEVVTQPQNGTLSLESSFDPETFSSEATGGFTFTPDADFAGTDSFEFRVFDGAEWSAPATVTIDVQNNAPILASRAFEATNGSGTAGWQQRSWTFNLAEAGLAVDPDQDSLNWQIDTLPENGTATISPNGILTYTATDSTFVGQEKVSVSVSDGYSLSDSSEISLSITNSSPLAGRDSYETSFGESLYLTSEGLLANDSDFDGDSLEIKSITAGDAGTLTATADGWIFDPGTATGITELSYIVTDGITDSAPMTIEVNVRTKPIWGTDRSFTLTQGGTRNFSVFDGASSGGTVTIVSPPVHGTLNGGNIPTSYTAPADLLGHDSFSYTITSGGSTSQVITYDFFVTETLAGGPLSAQSANYGPSAWVHLLDSSSPGQLTGVEDTTIVGTTVLRVRPGEEVSWNPGFGDSLDTLSANGVTLSPDATGGDLFFGDGHLNLSSSGDFTLTAGNTAGTSELEVTLNDGDRQESADVQLIVVNNPPVDSSAFFSGSAGSTITGSVADVVFDPDGDPLTFSGGGAGFSVTSDGMVSFTAPLIPPDGEGQFATTTVTVSDPYGATSSIEVTFAYQKTTLPDTPDENTEDSTTRPTANSDTFKYLSPSYVIGNVLSNDAKRGPGPWTASVVGPDKGIFGTIIIEGDGTTRYIPYAWHEEPFFDAGSDRFTYKITNALGESTQSVLTVIPTAIGRRIGNYGQIYYPQVATPSGDASSIKDDVYIALNAMAGDTIFKPVGGGGGNFHVTIGGMNPPPPGTGTTYWAGSTSGSLTLGSNGRIVSPIINTGDLWVGANRIEQPVIANNASVGSPLYVQSVKTTGDADIIGTFGKLGPVSVAGNAHSISVYGITGSVIDAPIRVEGNLGHFGASRELDTNISVGGDIQTFVLKSDFAGSLDVGGSIETILFDPLEYQLNDEGNFQLMMVGGEEVSAAITAGGDISEITHSTLYVNPARFTGSITAGGEIGLLSAKSIDASVQAGSAIHSVYAQEDISGDITAGTNIGGVTADGELSGGVKATDAIGNIYAQSISGPIDADNGSIMRIEATDGSITSEQIQASMSIGLVKAVNGSIDTTGDIAAIGGYLGGVEATGGISGTIKGSDTIGYVTAGGNIVGTVGSANGWVGDVTAGGVISGSLFAKQNIGHISAGGIIGDVSAVTGSIESITTGARIEGSIYAEKTIGPVSAGADILAPIKSNSGSIDSVIAGAITAGNITAPITADFAIGSVDVRGKLPDELEEINIDDVLLAIQAVTTALNAGDSVTAESIVIPDPTSLPASLYGDITAAIRGELYVGSVVADGTVSAPISSTGDVESVWAFEDITAPVTAENGATSVHTWGSLTADVTAMHGASVFSYDELKGDIKSDSGAASGMTLGKATGKVTGTYYAGVRALGDVMSSVTSSSGPASATSMGALKGDVDAASTVVAIARQEIGGDVSTADGRALAVASRLDGGSITNGAPSASGFGTAAASRRGGRPGYIPRPDADGNIDAFFAGGIRPYSSTAGSGTSQGHVDASGTVNLVALHDIQLRSVKAGKGITIASWGDVSLASADGGIGDVILRGINVAAKKAKGQDVTITAYGDYTGDVDAIQNASIFATSDVETKSVKGNQVSIFAGGDITAGGKGSEAVEAYASATLNSYGKVIGAGVKANKSVSIYGYAGVVAEVNASNGGNYPGAPQRVSIRSLGEVDAKVKAGEHAILSSGLTLKGEVDAGGMILLESLGGIEGQFTAGNKDVASLRTTELDTTHGLRAYALKTVGGTYKASDAVSISAFGDVSGSYSGTSVTVIAGISSEDLTTGSGFNGTVTASAAATIDAMGTVAGSVNAQGNIRVAAGEDISGLTVTHASPGGSSDPTSGTIDIGSDGAISSTTINGGHWVSVLSLEDSTATINRASRAFVRSHAAASPTITGVNNVVVHALGDVDATVKTTVNEVELQSFDGNVDAQVENAGKLLAVSIGKVDGTATDAGDIRVIASQVDGSYEGKSFAGTSLGTLNATIDVAQDATAYAASNINGSFDSAVGDISLLSRGPSDSDAGTAGGGNIGATVTSGRSASAISLAGEVSGEITANNGSAFVFAGKAVSGDVDAAGTSTVFAVTDQSSKVTADGNVRVTVLRNASGVVTSLGGNVTVSAGEKASGAVTADTGVTVIAITGDVTGSVSTTNGEAEVIAGGKASGAVTAASGATVIGVRDVSGTVNSGIGSATVASIGGSVSSPITAGKDISVTSLGDVSGVLNAGADVKVVGWAGLTSNVTAGGSIDAHLSGDVSGALTADEDNFVWTSGDISGAITATNGWTSLEAWGDFSSTVNAPNGIVDIWSAGNVSGSSVTAGETVSVFAYGNVDVTVTGQEDVHLQAFGNLNANVTAQDMVDIAGFQATNVTVNTPDAATVFSLGNLNASSVVANEGVSLATYGSLNVNANATSGSVGTWSLEGTSGSILADEYAGSVSWGPTSLATSGQEGAFAWSYGNLTGGIVSLAGHAVAVSLGDSSASVIGNSVAGVVSAGNVTGSVLSFGDAVAWAGGALTGNVTANNGNAVGVAIGDLSSTISATEFAIGLAEGNLTGSVHAGTDALAFSRGNVSGNVVALEDIVLVLAGGNVSGMVVGGGDVYDVFAYGDVDGTISAMGTAGDGIVHIVEAIGDISGTISATSTIEVVRAGGAVTAGLSASVLPSVIEFDPNVAVENPPLPASTVDLASLATDLAAVRSELVAKRDDEVAARNDDISENATDKTDLLNRISTGRSKQASKTTDLETQNQDRLDNARQRTTNIIDASRASLAEADEELLKTLTRSQSNARDARTRAIDLRDSGRDAAIVEATGATDKAFERASQETAANGEKRRALDQDKAAYIASAPTIVRQAGDLIGTVASALKWAVELHHPGTAHVAIPEFWESIRNNSARIGDLHGQLDYDNPVATAAWFSALDLIGATSVGRVLIGFDLGSMSQVPTTQRVFEGVLVIGSGLSIARGFRTPNCFVADTPVLNGYAADSGNFVAQTEIPAYEDDAATPWLIVGIGAAVTAWGAGRLAERKRKPKNKQPQPDRTTRKPIVPVAKEEEVDSLFESSDSTVMLDDVASGESVVRESPRHDGTPVPTTTSKGTDTPSKNGLLTRISSVCALIALVTLGIGGFLKLQGPLASVELHPTAVASFTNSTASPRYTSKPIQDLRAAGDRVLADNPETPGQALGDYGEFNRETWRVVRMHIDKPDGGSLKVSLARPLAWIEAARRDDAGRLWLEFEELGIASWATVISVDDCPESIYGTGRLITGTFEHSSGDVLNLFVKGETKPIGTTSNHPFWSEDRQEFVQAGQLRTGEKLLLAGGTTTNVERLVPISHEQPVYNLEVDGEHVYFIGSTGILVHNSKQYVALGLGKNLEKFSSRVRGVYWTNWRKHGLSSVNPLRNTDLFPLAFEQATNRAKKIFFDLKGFKISRALKSPDKWSVHGNNMTNMEFKALLKPENRHLLKKTVFDWNGKQISGPDMLKFLQENGAL